MRLIKVEYGTIGDSLDTGVEVLVDTMSDLLARPKRWNNEEKIIR